MTNPARPHPFTDPTPPPPPAWREGELMVTVRHARVVDACFRCGEPARQVRRLQLYWHHPAWYLLILASPLIYALVAMFIRDRADLELGLCARHGRRRVRATVAGWGGVLGGLAAFGLAFPARSGGMAVAGLGALIVGIIVLAVRRTVTVARMDERLVRLKGVSPRLLETLPSGFGEQPQPLPRAWVPR